MWWQRWVPICIYVIYEWRGGAEQNSCRFTVTSLKAKILTVSALWTAVTLDLRKVKDMTLTTMLSSFCQNDLRKPKVAAARGIQALICTNPYSKSNWQKKWPFIKTRKENPLSNSQFVPKRWIVVTRERRRSKGTLSLLHRRNSEGMKNTTTLSAKDKVHNTGLIYFCHVLHAHHSDY